MKSILCIVLIAFAASALSQTVSQFINDNNVLNYALTLENFEAELYRINTASYSDQAYTDAGFPAGSFAAINFIGAQEATHAQQLKNVLTARGWPYVPACTNYNFTGLTNNLPLYVRTLATVELVGTGAYDGAAGAITDKNLLTIAAGIATVEARHTAILNFIINAGAGNTSFPTVGNAQTNATTFDQTIALVTPFFGGATCPTNTTATAYNGSRTVGSLLFDSYRWQSANSLRGQSSVLATFYAQNVAASTNDIAVLQYALALENLEAVFYRTFSYLYSAQNITDAVPGVAPATAQLISLNIAAIGAHEAAHVSFLTATILALRPNATVGTECPGYGFANVGLNSTATFLTFLSVAAQVENIGVQAYVGAISYIANADVAAVAATIATVEGNHAAYLTNLLANNGSNLDNQPKPAFANTAGANVSPATADAGVSPAALLNTNVAVQALIPLATCGNFIGNPSPAALLTLANPVDFFNDQVANPLNTFVSRATTAGTSTTTATGTSTTTATGTNTNTATGTGTGTGTATRSSAVAMAASFGIVALALAL